MGTVFDGLFVDASGLGVGRGEVAVCRMAGGCRAGGGCGEGMRGCAVWIGRMEDSVRRMWEGGMCDG